MISVDNISPVIIVQDLDGLIGFVHSVVDAYATETIPVFAFGFVLEGTDTTLVIERRLSDDLKCLP